MPLTPGIDVIYAGNMKAGDLFSGQIDRDAPTSPVQPIARALGITEIAPYTDDHGKKMVRLVAGAPGELVPLPINMQVMLVRP